MLSLEDDSTSSGSSKALKEKKEREERKERTRSAEKAKVEVPTDILHPELYRALSEWRTAKTKGDECSCLCDYATESIDGEL